jgi:hypothetical protein
MSRNYEWPFPIPATRLHKVLSEHPAFSNELVTEAASFTVNKERHAGRTTLLNKTTGITATLPAATGSGECYKFVLLATIASSSAIIKVANSTDTMVGVLETTTTTGATTNGFCEAAGGTDDTITMNGTTTGGIVGSWVTAQDIGGNKWLISGGLIGSGTLATSLSATV